MSEETATQAAATQQLIEAAIYAVSGAKNHSRTYGHGDHGNPMCIEDGYMGEPFASRLVAAVHNYQFTHVKLSEISEGSAETLRLALIEAEQRGKT